MPKEITPLHYRVIYGNNFPRDSWPEFLQTILIGECVDYLYCKVSDDVPTIKIPISNRLSRVVSETDTASVAENYEYMEFLKVRVYRDNSELTPFFVWQRIR